MMSRYRRFLRPLLATMAVGAVLGIGFAAPQAAMAAAPVEVHHRAMLPGEVRTTSQELTVPVRARVAGTNWATRGATAEWTVTLCTDNEFTAWEDLADTTLAAGAHELRTTVRMPDDISQGAVASAHGTVVFVEAGAALPSTGGTLAGAALGAGIAAVVGGFIIVIARRRTEEETEEPS